MLACSPRLRRVLGADWECPIFCSRQIVECVRTCAAFASRGLTRLREFCRPPTDPATATLNDAAAQPVFTRASPSWVSRSE